MTSHSLLIAGAAVAGLSGRPALADDGLLTFDNQPTSFEETLNDQP